MSIDSIRGVLSAAGRVVSRTEVRKMFEAAQDGGALEPAERTELQHILNTEGSKFTNAAKAEFSRLFGTTPTPPAVPAGPEKVTYQADHQPWTTTYWPMADSGGTGIGSASSNLWSRGGPLDKLDGLLKARGGQAGARDFELRPNLNWLVNQAAGHYLPSSSLSETDAEKTTGVDFNHNGKIDDHVAYDFIGRNGQFGKDGKTDGTMSVGWWGSCDKVARAGILFKEPTKDVTLDGVTFTAQDIKGLLTVLADSQGGGSKFVGNRYDDRADQIVLNDGQRLTGTITTEVNLHASGVVHQQDVATIDNQTLPDQVKITLADGTEKTLARGDIKSVAREDRQDDPALFHTTIAQWLKSGRPAVMDKDSSEHVWNFNFYRADDTLFKNGLKPSWAIDDNLKNGFHGPAGDGQITWVDRVVTLGGSGGTEHYRYWLEEKNGQTVNSGWAAGSRSPDFLWAPETDAAFTGTNARNPFVDPRLVKEIYEKSIA